MGGIGINKMGKDIQFEKQFDYVLSDLARCVERQIKDRFSPNLWIRLRNPLYQQMHLQVYTMMEDAIMSGLPGRW